MRSFDFDVLEMTVDVVHPTDITRMSMNEFVALPINVLIKHGVEVCENCGQPMNITFQTGCSCTNHLANMHPNWIAGFLADDLKNYEEEGMIDMRT